VKDFLRPHAIQEAVVSDAPDSGDRKVDGKKMTLQRDSLAFFCHQSFCQARNLRTVQKLRSLATLIER
jgi:hypothetical protein